MIGDGLPLSDFGAEVVLAIEDAKSVEGIAFSIRKRFNISPSGVVNIVLDPAGFTGRMLVFQPIGWDSIGGPFEVDIYAGITANADGTPLTIFNRNFDAGIPSQIVAQINPTSINLSGAIGPIELLAPSDGTGAVGTSGASSNDAIVSVLDPDLKYLIRITNTDGTAAGRIGLKSDHFEVPNP